MNVFVYSILSQLGEHNGKKKKKKLQRCFLTNKQTLTSEQKSDKTIRNQ